MKKLTILLFVAFVVPSFSLSLSQVREALGECAIPRDFLEMDIRISVKGGWSFPANGNLHGEQRGWQKLYRNQEQFPKSTERCERRQNEDSRFEDE